ncbi:N-acetylglucosamine-6-phosphate deacetylase [Devosia ginsengisoli]|uniref:N-acetylglucosamine-6-phosphate deacetylase n=1 Tax=Devosia ginsengisoli TaxID=400770 RepID=UPI0026E97382|nr:amidohydrolase family protein [Devosia ginsengisoli]MCR6673566.1 amidohydrolase family protein [Devosia ginsengisoli]
MSGSGEISGIDPATGQPRRIHFENGLITRIEPAAEAEHYLAAGLIDLQVNGYAGHDLNSGTVDAATVRALGQALLQHGVTSFAPTLITASEAGLLHGLRTIALARASDPVLAQMIGHIHVEGPWISAEDGARGAHPAAHIRAIDLDEFQRWQSACDGLVGMVTLSPHSPDAPEKIPHLVRMGVQVAIGHTHATPAQIAAAAEAGASVSNHLGNGIATTLPRHPNAIWSQLADDRLTAGLIADGHHLDANTFKAMLRAKGAGRAFLVSDAVALGGLPPGRYRQPIGGDVELSADGRLSLADTPYLAGAARNLAEGVAIAIAMAGLTLAEALDLASRQPGRLMGGRGRLEVGAAADVICFDWAPGQTNLDIRSVYLRGERVVG